MEYHNKKIKSKNTKHDTNANTISNTISNTNSFLKTLETIDNNQISVLNTDYRQKDVDEIIIKYLNLKKKLNLMWNNID